MAGYQGYAEPTKQVKYEQEKKSKEEAKGYRNFRHKVV